LIFIANFAINCYKFLIDLDFIFVLHSLSPLPVIPASCTFSHLSILLPIFQIILCFRSFGYDWVFFWGRLDKCGPIGPL